MESIPSNDRPITPAERCELLSAEMTFLHGLLKRPFFEDRTPNAFERLREYRVQIALFQTALEPYAAGQAAALHELQNRWNRWKTELYRYLNAKLGAEDRDHM